MCIRKKNRRELIVTRKSSKHVIQSCWVVCRWVWKLVGGLCSFLSLLSKDLYALIIIISLSHNAWDVLEKKEVKEARNKGREKNKIIFMVIYSFHEWAFKSLCLLFFNHLNYPNWKLCLLQYLSACYGLLEK